VFDRIHCSCRIRFIRKIGRYSSVEDFTVHIFNQIDFDRFLPNFTDRFFQKLTKSEGTDFSVSVFLTRLMLRRSESIKSIRNQIQQTLRNPLPPSLSRLNGGLSQSSQFTTRSNKPCETHYPVPQPSQRITTRPRLHAVPSISHTSPVLQAGKSKQRACLGCPKWNIVHRGMN
jgi:hypothetical protein